MASKKQTIVHNVVTRSRAASTAGGMIPQLADDRSHITKDTSFSSPQEPIASIWPLPQHEDQLFQML